jgi:hypothetical protein
MTPTSSGSSHMSPAPLTGSHSFPNSKHYFSSSCQARLGIQLVL